MHINTCASRFFNLTSQSPDFGPHFQYFTFKFQLRTSSLNFTFGISVSHFKFQLRTSLSVIHFHVSNFNLNHWHTGRVLAKELNQLLVKHRLKIKYQPARPTPGVAGRKKKDSPREASKFILFLFHFITRDSENASDLCTRSFSRRPDLVVSNTDKKA